MFISNFFQESEQRLRSKKSQQNPETINNPSDFKVQFISGKEIADEVDNERKSFQVHRIKITNLERNKVGNNLLNCLIF